MAIWINQDGPPTTLLDWLKGAAVEVDGEKVPPLAPGAAVDQAAWLDYYEHIPFIRQHLGADGADARRHRNRAGRVAGLTSPKIRGDEP